MPKAKHRLFCVIFLCTARCIMSQREEEKVPVPAQGGVPSDDPHRNEENQTDEPAVQALDEGDIAILKTYVRAIL